MKYFRLTGRFPKQVLEILGFWMDGQLGKGQGHDFKARFCWKFWCLMDGWRFVKKSWNDLKFGEFYDHLGFLSFGMECEG